MFSLGIGCGHKDSQGQWLDVFYPKPLHKPDDELTTKVQAAVGYKPGCHLYENGEKNLDADLLAELGFPLTDTLPNLVVVLLAEDQAPTSVPEVYLKLHLLSHRLVRPNSINLSGIFGILPNVVWTNKGPVATTDVGPKLLQSKLTGEPLQILSVDKFPKMTDYVIPSKVRIGDTRRVRLGAYLGEGTTIMHAGFVNFNAGTEGPNMIEGRIAAGIFVGSGSDLGGGCSTMGTLSGGHKETVSIGKNSLVGANAGVAIPLGDNCTIEAGLYVTAGTKVTLIGGSENNSTQVKALSLANKPGLLFRRNSQTGVVECLPKKGTFELNQELHQNN